MVDPASSQGTAGPQSRCYLIGLGLCHRSSLLRMILPGEDIYEYKTMQFTRVVVALEVDVLSAKGPRYWFDYPRNSQILPSVGFSLDFLCLCQETNHRI